MLSAPRFQIGGVYHRRNDIHSAFGGQRQGGISTPSGAPAVLLFTGASGVQHGYEDNWTDDGVFTYTGEGQRGDMQFTRGNAAIRDHAAGGKELLLFENVPKRKGFVRFLGTFNCASWEYGQGPDTQGRPRRTIRFHLVRTREIDVPLVKPTRSIEVSLEELKRKAYEAAKSASQGARTQASRTYRERSDAVRDYVLARAGGECEACENPAPFDRLSDETPYLEPHHTIRLTDDGPDHPRWVAALCPNCHREAHHGLEGKELNSRIIERLGQMERD